MISENDTEGYVAYYYYDVQDEDDDAEALLSLGFLLSEQQRN